MWVGLGSSVRCVWRRVQTAWAHCQLTPHSSTGTGPPSDAKRCQQGKNAASRSALDQPGFRCLGIEPSHKDKQLAKALSDALDLDEVSSLELLITAHLRGRNLSLQAAAGIYYEERRAQIMVLVRMLQICLDQYLAATPESWETIHATLEYLVSRADIPASGQTLLTQLCNIVKVRRHACLAPSVAPGISKPCQRITHITQDSCQPY